MEAESQKRAISKMTTYQLSIVFRRISPDLGAKLIPYCEDIGSLSHILDPSVLARFVNQMEKPNAKKFLEKISESYREEIRSLLRYPTNSAGSLMECKVTLFHPRDTVARVIKMIKKFRGRNLGSIFLIDLDGKLKGRVYLQDIITSDTATTLAELSKNTPCVNEMAPREEIVELVEKNRLSSLPVVVNNDVVLGVIYHESLISLAHEDALNGIQTMVGVSKEEQALSPVWFAVRKRLPWLTINLLTTFLAAFVVGLFEDTIAMITALAILLPVVAGQSGNTGAQSQAVTMRGLALREIRLRHKWQVILKEGSVGGINGIIVGFMCSLSVLFWSGSSALALVIGVAMVLAMVAASLSGAAIPMILTSLGQDPATSSSIVLTTITDIVGFLSFLGLATIFGSYLI